MSQVSVEVLDAKDSKKPAVIIDDVVATETLLAVKEKLSKKSKFFALYFSSYRLFFLEHLPIEQISLRLEPRGKALRDEDSLSQLGLTTGNAQLYYRNLGPQIAWKTVFLLEYAGPLFVYPIFYLRPNFIYGKCAFVCLL